MIGMVAPIALMGLCEATLAQDVEKPQVRRLRGVIDRNETWSGTILITDDLLIDGATITVSPGTTIEFVDTRPGHVPTLTIGSENHPGGCLKMLATADRCVTFRSRKGMNPGRIVVNIHARTAPSREPISVTSEESKRNLEPADVSWQHVRFERLGGSAGSSKGKARGRGRPQPPAVTFNVLAAAHTLGIANCEFANSTRLEIVAADEAHITLLNNTFTQPVERRCIQITNKPGKAKPRAVRILNQTLPGAIVLRSVPTKMSGCILIGPNAAIVVQRDTSPETEIRGNYVHNTTKADDGHYCLNCENPNAVITENVLRGGTSCVYYGSKHMSRNVLISSPSLTGTPRSSQASTTHELVRALPAEAIFENNLLIGPALSLLAPQPLLSRPNLAGSDAKPTIIRHNVFDGFSRSPRAIHLNQAGTSHAPVAIWNNLFLRVHSAIFNETGNRNTPTYIDHNAIAPPPRRPTGGNPSNKADHTDAEPVARCVGWGPHDIRENDASGLRLRAIPATAPRDFDADIRSGQMTIANIRDQLFLAYRPTNGSPLIRAGRPDTSTEENPVPPPSIGLQ